MVERNSRILEIGPSYAPIAPKSGGWNSFALDHAPQDELRRKYAGAPGVDIDDIETVDFLWDVGNPSTAVPKEMHGTFDACVASHVLEHVPNPIGFLGDISQLLRPGGVLSMILPDKRYVLDCMRPVSTAGAWLDAADRMASRHSRGTLYDCHAYAVTNDGATFWGAGQASNLRPHSNLLDVLAVIDRAKGSGYVDAHAWVFTPTSFKLIMYDMYILKMLPFGLAKEFPTTGCEFYMSFRKEAPPSPDAATITGARLSMMSTIQTELRDTSITSTIQRELQNHVPIVSRAVRFLRRRVHSGLNAIGLR